MSITFTLVASSTTTTITPIAGSVQYGGDHDDRGGRVTAAVRAANARNGSCQTISDSTTETTIIALVSAPGAGDYTVAGTDVTGYESYNAVVDVNLGEGEDGVEVATITWKGTVATA